MYASGYEYSYALRPPAFRAVKATRGGWLLLAQREQNWAHSFF